MFFVVDLLQMSVEPITEDRAQKLLERLDLMSKLREKVIPMPDLLQKLIDIPCPSTPYLPRWWIPAKHDRDLLVGVAR
jgi:chromodomain-helicase-DNA-binding protein 7